VFPESEEVHGRDGALQFLVTQMEAFELMWVDPLEFIDAGDRVVVPVRIGGGRGTRASSLSSNEFTSGPHRGGKVRGLEIYPSRHQALEAVGLSE
jgi:hypothetical protein